jgi:large subunit ribosomal protein L2
MALIKFKPTSPGRRNQSGYTFEEITKTEPEKALISPRKAAAGRNNRGVITIRGRVWSQKAKRKIDFKRDNVGVPAGSPRLNMTRNSRPHRLIFYANGESALSWRGLNLKLVDTKSRRGFRGRAGNHLP